MTQWQTAMLYAVPFILFSGLGGTGTQRLLLIEPKARTWVAMICGSLVAREIYAPVNAMPFAVYIAIDLLSALAVLSRPKLMGNQVIGALFGLMIVSHIVAALFGLAGDGAYRWSNIIIGWAQWLVLLIWSQADAGDAVVRYFRAYRARRNMGQATRAGGQGGIR